jgi:DNA-binding CsgD family transcriptional regulator
VGLRPEASDAAADDGRGDGGRRPFANVVAKEWECACGAKYLLTLAQAQPSRHDLSARAFLARQEEDLTEFQIRVLAHIASGLTDLGVADALGISVHRVRYAMRDLAVRLSARTRAEAVFIATRSGLLDFSFE